jgi:internalin A
MSSRSRGFLASPEGLTLLQAVKAERGWTFASIAERARVSVDTVSRLFHPERGKRVSGESVRAIARALEVAADAIVPAGEWPSPLAEAERRIQDALESGATELDLSGLGLTALPESLGNLANLTDLYLSQNQLTTLPESLGNLANLTDLYLHQNQLTAIPESLGNLANLTDLYLHQNQLTAIPESLGNLANLTRLDLDQNQLTAIPESLGQLANLTELYLHQNQLTAIPESLGQLANLTELYLDQNQLTAIPESLGQLANLTRLDLDQNQLTAIPESLGQLANLTRLDLDQNQLTAIPESLGNLASLEQLFLHENKCLGLSNEVLGPTWEEVENGAAAANAQDILNYYFRLLAELTPLNEAKLILVGFGAVGKTSLVNRLVYQNFDPNSAKTEGIQITQWPIRLNDSEDIKLHVWDFGGQEIMHSTHQFFLTERSLYLLVLNGRQGHEDADAEYWLELIQSFGGSSPVIVVLNKIKEHPFDVNRGALQQKFPNIREFIATDCETSLGIDQLRATIECETDALEHLRDPFPASWVAIKNKLAAMADNYISFEQYRAICQTDGETDYGAQNSLAVHLHSLGIALNYKDDLRRAIPTCSTPAGSPAAFTPYSTQTSWPTAKANSKPPA